ncbi:MAG: hypothetical protein IT531_15840 [Burkholderiales bacterium]|nr:hypothetical protein [Burkholderiales bacterium]
MKFSSRYLDSLKAPLALLALVVIAGTGMVYWTRAEIAKNALTLAGQEAQLKEARNRFQRSGDERDLIVRFLGPYQELRARGLIGPEQRINWLDALRIANEQARLFGAEYQVSTQQPYPYAQELNAARLGMAQSVMKLSLRLAHEGELMRFFRLLEQHNAGAFDVNECVLERATAAEGVFSAQPNLRAECELAWITINPETLERKP